jgi:hypothetical protein
MVSNKIRGRRKREGTDAPQKMKTHVNGKDTKEIN